MYLVKNICLGELDYILDELLESADELFSDKFVIYNEVENFSRECKSCSYIEIPKLEVKIYECWHERYDLIKQEYIKVYRYYKLENFNENKVLYTYDGLSFILCVYNYLRCYKLFDFMGELDDLLCKVYIAE